MNEISSPLKSIIENISKVRTRKTPENGSPHKFIFLLCLIKLYEIDANRLNKFYLNEELERLFNNAWMENIGQDQERNAIEHPFYHLQSDGFWFLSVKKGYEYLYDLYKESKNIRLTKRRIIETVDYGYLREDFHICFKDMSCRNILKKILIERAKECVEHNNESMGLQYLSINIDNVSAPNPFVAYLNSLHSRDAGNENALAESQACNPFFSLIHVEHPLVKEIVEQLRQPSGRSIILTGHAGDGKSTLALAVYKRLKSLDENKALNKPLNRREDIFPYEGNKVIIIKDISEWPTSDREALLSELMDNKTRMLLVSNTGALLDTLCSFAERTGLGSRAEWEPRILEAMDFESSDMSFGKATFKFFNLALQDNLSLTQSIFERMINPENWKDCMSQECRVHCPIYRNVMLFGEKSKLATCRLFLAYRRMYEYGTRLTIRQLTAHIAYLLTAGMEYADIRNLASRSGKPLISEFLFYNRFFGDNGHSLDQAATRMRVIKEVRSQGFGERPCPATERHLWLLTHGDDFKLGIPLMEEEFGRLRRYGSQSIKQSDDMTPDEAREQVRRMLYFLHEFTGKEQGDSFLRQFLGSLAILKWERWQDVDARLSMDEANHFKQRVFHVLQEQFTGVRFPEIGNSEQSRLYITLSRRRQEIRQSAQVVLSQIDFSSEFRICLTADERGEMRRDLVLVGQGRLDGIRLSLNLPFLDYMLARHQGEVGETLQAAYADRLERLKADLIKRCRSNRNDDMLLVRLQTNNIFLRQLYAVSQGKLEVSNAS